MGVEVLYMYEYEYLQYIWILTGSGGCGNNRHSRKQCGPLSVWPIPRSRDSAFWAPHDSQLHLTLLGMFTTVHTINPVRVTIFHFGITCLIIKRTSIILNCIVYCILIFNECELLDHHCMCFLDRRSSAFCQRWWRATTDTLSRSRRHLAFSRRRTTRPTLHPSSPVRSLYSVLLQS